MPSFHSSGFHLQVVMELWVLPAADQFDPTKLPEGCNFGRLLRTMEVLDLVTQRLAAALPLSGPAYVDWTLSESIGLSGEGKFRSLKRYEIPSVISTVLPRSFASR